MDKEKRELFAKALAYFLYREVVEDAHSDYNISQEDMFAMNTKSVNRAKLLVDILDDESCLTLLYYYTACPFATNGITLRKPKKLLK